MHIALAFIVLSITCAIASTASAQQPTCERVLFHVLPKEGCVRESVTSYRERKAEATATFRAREAQAAAYEQNQRYRYGSAADDICFGCNPHSNMATLYGRDFGESGQWDHWGSTYYGSYRYGIRDSRFYRGIIWKFPHAEFPNGHPGAPTETRAPKGYEWKCDRDVFDYYCGYTRKGSEVFKSILVAGALVAGIVALDHAVR